MTNTSQGLRSTSIVALSNFTPALNKMIQAGYVNGDQLKQAQIESQKSGKRLTEVLEALTGQPLPPELLRLYKKQQMFERKIVYGG